MAHRPVITFPAPKLERDHLFILKLLHYFSGDFRSVDNRSTHSYLITIAMKHNFSKCDLIAGLDGKLFDGHRFAGADPILFIPCADDCVCHGDVLVKMRKVARWVPRRK